MARIIAIADSIKDEIAKKLARQASTGYTKDHQGEWFVVNGSSVVHRQSNVAGIAWSDDDKQPNVAGNPWNDDDTVISVEDLVFEFGGAGDDNAEFDNSGDGEDYNMTVILVYSYVPDSYDAEAWDAKRG